MFKHCVYLIVLPHLVMIALGLVFATIGPHFIRQSGRSATDEQR